MTIILNQLTLQHLNFFHENYNLVSVIFHKIYCFRQNQFYLGSVIHSYLYNRLFSCNKINGYIIQSLGEWCTFYCMCTNTWLARENANNLNIFSATTSMLLESPGVCAEGDCLSRVDFPSWFVVRKDIRTVKSTLSISIISPPKPHVRPLLIGIYYIDLFVSHLNTSIIIFIFSKLTLDIWWLSW